MTGTPMRSPDFGLPGADTALFHDDAHAHAGDDPWDNRMRFRSAFDHAPIGMALVGMDGRWWEVNGALCAMLGYGADELVRLRWQDLTHPDDVAEDEALLARLQTGAADGGLREKRFIRSDGAEVWTQLSVSHVHDGREDTSYFIQQIQDISVRRRAERVMRRQALLFNALHDAVIVTDIQGRITEWNPAATRLVGMTPEEVLGRHLRSFVADGGLEPAGIGHALRSTGRWSGELCFRRAGGRIGVAEINAVTLGRGDTRRHAYVAVARDVTDRREAERLVHDRNRQLAALLGIQQSIAQVGLDRAAMLHLVCHRVLDLTRADGASVALVEGDRLVNVAATGIEEYWTGCEVPLAEGPVSECVATGRTLWVEDAVSHPDLDPILCREGAAFRSCVVVPLVHDSRPLGLLSVSALASGAFDASDVNAMQILAGTLSAVLSLAERFEENQTLVLERTAALRALGASEERFRALIENARDVVTVLSVDGTIEYASPAVTRVLGYEPGDLVGSRGDQYIHPDDLPGVRARFDEVLRHHGRVEATEYRCRAVDGSWRQLEGRISNLVHHGVLGSIVVNVRDVTEARRLEGQLRQAQKLEAIGQLAAGIAHEINTPTQYVGDNVRFLDGAFRDVLDLLDRHEEACRGLAAHPAFTVECAELSAAAAEADLPYLREEIPSALMQSLEGLERIAEIVRSVKAFSHPGSDSPEPTDLNREISNTVSVSRNEWKYVAEVSLDLCPDLPPVHCLAGEISQVVLNLVVNAAHAIADRLRTEGSLDRGTITLRTRRDGEHVEVRVSDTGTGIPLHVRERVFDPFFTTKEVGHGTGQGLAIARTVVVEKHGGAIHFETEEGVGTTFILRLPFGTTLADPVEVAW